VECWSNFGCNRVGSPTHEHFHGIVRACVFSVPLALKKLKIFSESRRRRSAETWGSFDGGKFHGFTQVTVQWPLLAKMALALEQEHLHEWK
jgi:hypothetical protein